MRPNEIAVEDLPSPGNEDVTNTRFAVVPNPRLVKPTLSESSASVTRDGGCSRVSRARPLRREPKRGITARTGRPVASWTSSELRKLEFSRSSSKASAHPRRAEPKNARTTVRVFFGKDGNTGGSAFAMIRASGSASACLAETSLNCSRNCSRIRWLTSASRASSDSLSRGCSGRRYVTPVPCKCLGEHFPVPAPAPPRFEARPAPGRSLGGYSRGYPGVRI